MQKRFHYNLESWDGDEDEDEFGNYIPIDMALQNVAHATNIMVREWIEALTLGEVGQDQIFAPNHTFGSFHGDETEDDIRDTAHRAWFYQTNRFLMDVDQIGPADYDFYVECRMTLDTSIITRFIGVSTPTEMSREAQDEIYDRVLRAATAHAEGRGAICFFDNPELAGAGGEPTNQCRRRVGRRPLLTPTQQAEALRMAGGEKSHAEIGQIVRVSRSNISRFLSKTQSS